MFALWNSYPVPHFQRKQSQSVSLNRNFQCEVTTVHFLCSGCFPHLGGGTELPTKAWRCHISLGRSSVLKSLCCSAHCSDPSSSDLTCYWCAELHTWRTGQKSRIADCSLLVPQQVLVCTGYMKNGWGFLHLLTLVIDGVRDCYISGRSEFHQRLQGAWGASWSSGVYSHLIWLVSMSVA